MTEKMQARLCLSSKTGIVRCCLKTEAEFEQIVDTFNVMAHQLATERSEKEQLTQKKNRMLLELSHDIKTLVATIKSYARALADGLVPQERITDTYQIIDAKANRVQRLTEDMFAISSIIAEKHGGKITYCRRAGENVFELHLPL